MQVKQQLNSQTVSSRTSSKLTVWLLLFFIFTPISALANELAGNAQQSKKIRVAPGDGTLQAAIDSAQSGDTLILESGIYSGSVTIHRSLTLLADNANAKHSSIIDGQESSHVITISASDVFIKGLNIQHSGKVLKDENSGIFITKEGDRTRIESNYFENNLIGIYLKGPESVTVSDNTIIGSQFHRINDRGNGVYLWNTPGSIIKNNDIRYGRDGIFVNVSRNNIFRGNRLSNLRFAIHYMYTNDSEISNNISINNHVGYALMFSDRIVVKNNTSTGDSERGLFFNFANYSVIAGNRVTSGNGINTDKCVFIYNANFNQINNNSFEECNIGIHFTAGSEKNEIYANAFINNRTQVKYVGTRHIEWSKNGSGNYWSDNIAFDIDDNGIGDQIYKPNDLVDQIVWRHPLAKLLLNSPSMQVLKWAQSEFPSLHPGGVTDTVPLMRPPQDNTANKPVAKFPSSRALTDG